MDPIVVGIAYDLFLLGDSTNISNDIEVKVAFPFA